MPNVTLSLPDDLLREARHLAADECVWLSRFVARILQQRVQAARAYRIAQQRQLRLLREGMRLRTGGHVT